MQGKAEQEHRGISGTHAMTRDINKPVQGKHERANQGGEAEALVGADF